MNPAAGPTAERARALLERVLRDGARLDGEYPLVFRPGAPGEVVAVEEQGQVVSACAVLVRDALVGRERVRLGLIGSVATHPEQRGRGLASRVLQRAESALAAQGCQLALLWADDPDFYVRRGWRPAGCEIDFVVEPAHLERLPDGSPATIRAAAPDDHGAVHRLYERHPARVDRTPEETHALLCGPGVDTLVLERGRDIAAYACCGRGRDLERCVHEWGGAPEDVLALVREHGQRLGRRGQAGPLFLMTPIGALSLHARLEACGVTGVNGLLGMAKVLDAAAAAELVRRATRGTISAGLVCERDADGTQAVVQLDGPGGRLELAPQDLLDLLLPARGARPAIAALERIARTALSGLPLGLYVWGLDSI